MFRFRIHWIRIKAFWWVRIQTQIFDGQRFKNFIVEKIFFGFRKCYIFTIRPSWRTFKLQEKPPFPQKTSRTWNFFTFFLCTVHLFSPLPYNLKILGLYKREVIMSNPFHPFPLFCCIHYNYFSPSFFFICLSPTSHSLPSALFISVRYNMSLVSCILFLYRYFLLCMFL